MNYLQHAITKAERSALQKMADRLSGLKPQLEADEQHAREQADKCNEQQRVTMASAQRREESKMILESATYRVEKLCEARNALRRFLEACSTP